MDGFSISVLAIFIIVILYVALQELYKFLVEKRDRDIRRLELEIEDRDKRIRELEVVNERLDLDMQREWDTEFSRQLREGEKEKHVR